MRGPCSDSFRALAERLGGISCEDAAPFVTLRAPSSLASATMPVVELLTVLGAVLALVHALRLRRLEQRSAPLGLWLAAVVFVAVLEPPLYFPHQIGATPHLDVIFAHNVFSVMFLYDRLPLYIVALYPSGIYLAYTLVERAGVFAARGALVGAVAVGFLHQCLYEIFDHVGPQFRWWAWNPDVPQTSPALGSVPLTSMVIFAFVAPSVLAYTFRKALVEPETASPLGRGSFVGRTLLVGLLTPPLMVLVASPLSSMLLPPRRDETLIAVAHYVVLAGAAVITAFAYRSTSPAASRGDRVADAYPVVHGVLHLVVYTGLWCAAAPGLLAARAGLTPEGTPVGSPGYALACALVCAFALSRVRAR